MVPLTPPAVPSHTFQPSLTEENASVAIDWVVGHEDAGHLNRQHNGEHAL
jgi:hypothetical protein